MQILTQRGGYITVHSVRSNEVSFYIMVTVHTPLSREVFFVSEGHRKPETYCANLCD